MDDYELHTDENRHLYLSMKDKLTKNHHDYEQSQAGLMYDIPGHQQCLVTTMLKFKSKLHPSCKGLWQRPR